MERDDLLKLLVDIQYDRNDYDLARGTFRVRGDIVDVFPPYQQQQIRTQLADVLECVVSQQLIPRQNREGRVAAIEVMLSNSAIRNHIRESKTFQIASVMQTNRKLGMITMDDALLELYHAGDISLEKALSYAQDPVALRKRLY